MELFISISPWFWLGVLILCCIIEACTMGLTTIWGAIASLPLIFIAKTGLSVKWQLLIFIVLTVLLIVFTRPFAVKKLQIGKDKTNVNTLIGKEVLIVKSITKFEKGEAKTQNGVVWSAQSASEEEIAANTICKISGVTGNTLIVTPIN